MQDRLVTDVLLKKIGYYDPSTDPATIKIDEEKA
jgi:ribosomal protein S16